MKIQLYSLSMALCLISATALLGTGCAGDRYRQSSGEHIDDSATSSRVKRALSDETQIPVDSGWRGIAARAAIPKSRCTVLPSCR